jgi:hypothetical protein
MKVSIKKKIYDFEFDTLLGALYLFETSQHRVYDGGSVFDLYVLWYAILTLCNEGMTLTFQEFSNALNDQKLLKRIQDYYIERTQAIADLAEEENGEQPGDEGKKKD